MMFWWLPACLEHSTIPTFLCCSSCGHEPCSSAQGWCEEELGEGACSGHSRSRKREREDKRPGSVTLEVQVAAGCATSHYLKTQQRSPRSAEDSEGGVSCDRDHDAYRNHVRHLFLQNKISGLGAFNASVAAQASGARCAADVAGAGHYGRWTGKLARDFRRAMQGLGYWSGKDSDVVPLLLGTRSARKTREQELGRRELFRSNSTAALECQAELLCQARHQGRLDAGLGSHQKRKTVECFSWNVLGSQSAERYMFGLVEKDPW